MPRAPKSATRGVRVLLSKYPRRANAPKINNTKGSHRTPPPALGRDSSGAGRSARVGVSTLGRSTVGVRSTKCSIWVGESRSSSDSTVVTVVDSTVLTGEGTALGPKPRMRDNPDGAAAEISSLWLDSKSVSPEEPEAWVAIRFPSTPKVSGVINAVNFVADDALTPPDLATSSMTEEVLPPKILPMWRCPALNR